MSSKNLRHRICFAFGLLPFLGFGSDLIIAKENVEVVVDAFAQRTLKLAASEMTNYLSRIFSTSVSIVNKPTPGVNSIILGENEFSKKANLPAIPAKRDSFSYLFGEEDIFLAGRDDASKYAMDAYVGGNLQNISKYEMGTLFAVYWFLEEFAGCRFYFPGQFGTIVPQKDRLIVVKGLGCKKPDFAVRSVYMTGDGAWPDGGGKSNPSKEKARQWMRLRLQTEEVPCCHGLIYAKLPERFAKAHPEWFQL